LINACSVSVSPFHMRSAVQTGAETQPLSATRCASGVSAARRSTERDYSTPEITLRNNAIERSIADDSQLGRCETVGLRRRLHRQDECTGSTSAGPGLRAGVTRATIRSLIASTRSTRSWCSTMSRSPERTFFVATRARRASFAPPSTAIRPATGGYGERVERPEDLPAAIERSLTVTRREKRHALLNVLCHVWRQNELAPGFCPSLRCASANPDACRCDQANLLPGIAMWSNACRLKRLTRL
jgi:hypothetical protein